MQTLTLDIMLGDRFVCTIRYKHNPAFILTIKELADFAADFDTMKGAVIKALNQLDENERKEIQATKP